MFNTPSAALGAITEGSLRALVQSGEARLATLPGVPTFEEAGLPDTTFFGWTGVVGPAGFPRPVAERIAAVVRTALATDPAARGGLDLAGTEILGTSPAAFAALMAREAARWNAVIVALGLRIAE